MVTGNMDCTTTREAITGYNITSITTITYGDCPTPKTAAENGDATIATPNDPNAILTITGMEPADNAALETTSGTSCNVSVDIEKKTLTINYKQGNTDKCIEITLNTGDITKTDATVQYGHIFT